jgi:chromosome segregation ATPase
VRIFGWSLYALAQLLVAALAIVSFVLLMVYLPQIRSELQHARHHIKQLTACCNQSTTNINTMNQTLNGALGDIVILEGDVTNIFNNLTSIDGEIAVLEECCANNTAAIQTLNTELYDLDLRVGMTEADIDVLTENVGSLQLQIDNL